MFAWSGISRRFGPTTALCNAGFSVAPGDVLGVIGPNGSGKSTLLACAARLPRADGGLWRKTDSMSEFDAYTVTKR